MSIDVLQNKIRKRKNPAALVIAPEAELIPPEYLEQAGGVEAMAAQAYCCALLDGVKELIPAVRVSANAFALMGAEGLGAMAEVLEKATELGYYVILDWTALETPGQAKKSAKRIFAQGQWKCDGVVVSCWAGTDCVKPWFQEAGKTKTVFAAIKTANKSGSELQDLVTGGRTVYAAMADHLGRMGDGAVERCGYSRLGVMAGAYNGASVKQLRQNYPRMFLVVDGVDESGCNAKNASFALDKLGHGALICAGKSILGAWQEEEAGADPIACAREAAERMKRNIARYVQVL